VAKFLLIGTFESYFIERRVLLAITLVMSASELALTATSFDEQKRPVSRFGGSSGPDCIWQPLSAAMVREVEGTKYDDEGF
jgi:hypothetical protein